MQGDLLVQFTDGITETMNREKEEYGMDRLTKLLGNFSERESDYICYKVEAALKMFQGKKCSRASFFKTFTGPFWVHG